MFIAGHMGKIGASLLFSLLMLDAVCFYAVFKWFVSSLKNKNEQ